MHAVAIISAKQAVLLGDFNLPNIHGHNWSAPVGDASDFLFLDTFASLRLQQSVAVLRGGGGAWEGNAPPVLLIAPPPLFCLPSQIFSIAGLSQLQSKVGL